MKHLLFVVVVLLSGCASYGNKIDSNYANSIEKGVTTEQEVVSAMGQPMTVSVTPDGLKLYYYIYTRSQAKASTFIPIVGAFAGGADTETQILQIWFDDAGVVQNFAYNKSNSEVKTGLLAN